MRKRMLCDARFRLEIDVLGPLLIKAGEAGLSGPDMAFVRTYGYGDEVAHPYLPGTSLKGVFRSHAERIARTLRPEPVPVCLPYEFDSSAGAEQSCGKRYDKETPRHEVYRGECLACRTFGSLEFKGRVFIDDAYADDPKKLKLEVRDGVAIDRKTGGSAKGAKYDLEVLTAGTFATTITLDNFEAWQLGLVGLVLADLEDERLRLGTGTSRGLGHVRGRITSAELRYPARHDGRFVGIGSLATADERDRYNLFAGASSPKLPPGERSGIWSVHRLEGEALRSVFDAGRDELNAFFEQYRWVGGR